MNDIAQYMQQTGVLSKDVDEMDDYEFYLHYKTEYKILGVVLSRDEWEAMAEQYGTVMNDIAHKRNLAPTLRWDESAIVWGDIKKLENLADDLERQLGW